MTIAALNGNPVVLNGELLAVNTSTFNLYGIDQRPGVANGQYMGIPGDDEPLIPLVPPTVEDGFAPRGGGRSGAYGQLVPPRYSPDIDYGDDILAISLMLAVYLDDE